MTANSPAAERLSIGTAALAFFLLVGAARAEVALQGARWQRADRINDKVSKGIDIVEASILPGAALKGRMLVKVRLLNRGPAKEGILLRYAVTAKIGPLAQPQIEPAWALPYMLEEKRVPKIGANQFYEATLDPTARKFRLLRKIYRMGYWPQELKVQVMLEPRNGNAGALQILEAVLPFRK